MKNSLVVWSGGCDSTLVLHDLARHSSEAHPVRAVSFEHNQVPCAKEQYYARNRVLKVLRDRGHHIQLATIKVDVSDTGAFQFRGEGSNPQAVFWTLATQLLRDDEDLYFGYTRGADWWRDGRFARIFTEYQCAAGRRGCLYQPLGTMDRPAILHRLEKAGLLKLVWWCEGGALGGKKVRKNPCGKCRSCQIHKTALWQLKEFGPGFVQDPWDPAWAAQWNTHLAVAKGAT